MNWLALHIETNHAGLEPVGMLMAGMGASSFGWCFMVYNHKIRQKSSCFSVIDVHMREYNLQKRQKRTK